MLCVLSGAAYLGATKLSCKSGSKAITRMNTTDPRSSGIVIHNGVVYLTGHVGNIETLESSDVKAQTEQVWFVSAREGFLCVPTLFSHT